MKTVKVRIAVAVDPKGNWNSCGWSSGDESEKMDICIDGIDELGEARYWLEADLAIPEARTVAATVSSDE